jgi:hypothetical protein
LRYYAARYAINPADVIVGQGENEAGFASDVRHLPPGHVWILISHTIDENDKTILLKMLDASGHRLSEFIVSGAAVYQYDLSPR